jgi:hypothetical protein
LFVDQLRILIKKMQFLHKYDAKYSFKSIIALKHQAGHDPSSWPVDYPSSDPSLYAQQPVPSHAVTERSEFSMWWPGGVKTKNAADCFCGEA